MRNLSLRDQEDLSKFIRANNTQSQVLNAGMSNSKDLSLNHYLPIVLGNKHANWRATYSRYSSLVGNVVIYHLTVYKMFLHMLEFAISNNNP